MCVIHHAHVDKTAPGGPVVEVHGSLDDGIPACVCEAEMAGVPPFVLVVRVFVGGISELGYGRTELVLADSCRSEGKGLVHVVEAE